jgi:hypothetical protein
LSCVICAGAAGAAAGRGHKGLTDDDARFLERRQARRVAFEQKVEVARARQKSDAIYVGLLGTNTFGEEIRGDELPAYARERTERALVAMYLDQGRPDLAEQAEEMIAKYKEYKDGLVIAGLTADGSG